MSKDIKAIMETLTAGTAQVTPIAELEAKLKLDRPLKIKLGADPTAPDLHLGHAVIFEKLRQFQELGHEIYFLIGDFTARIGDPTGKSQTRKPLETEEIERNAKTYLNQLSKILDAGRTKIVYNSHWLSGLDLSQVIKIMAKTTLAQLITREDFANRLERKESIGFHELMYPLLQGYDSVFLNADVELGGTDQTFNLMMGRQLQEQFGQKPQVIITMPILEGLDGKQKMSKSLNNYIGLFESAKTAYAKLMSISDELMWRYWLLLGGKTDREIEVLKAKIDDGSLHPMELKKQMASTIVSKFWSREEANEAEGSFEAIFQNRDFSQVKELKVDLPESCWIVDLIKAADPSLSSSQAKRLIEEGAVKLDGQLISDFKVIVSWTDGMVLQAGKKLIVKLAKI